jgi:fructose-bisphosphate aldolase, class I
MINSTLKETIAQLTNGKKGILAADESTSTITKRFSSIGVDSTPETRRIYRELLLSSPIEPYISGVILFDETLFQQDSNNIPFPQLCKNRGIIPGIKVDKGLVYLPGTADEMITQGLEGLAERLKNYYQAGARFAKWRAVFRIGNHTPSPLAIKANAIALAHYAALCQQQHFVPIVEPEVLMEGDHDLNRCAEVTMCVLHHVFKALFQYQVTLEALLLKPNMVLAGQNYSGPNPSVQQVAQATLDVLRRTVPAAVPSINFLSGGQSPSLAAQHLNALNQQGPQPWRLNFSYGRALQDPALKQWKGQSKNIQAAQQALYQRAKLNAAAASGTYQIAEETNNN